MNSNVSPLSALAVSVSLATHLLVAAEPTEADRLFVLKVQPLLSEKCNGCHGDDAEKIKGGFDMTTREALLAGGDEFGDEVLVPGDAKKSFLVDTVKWADPDWEMPPKENDRLTPEQIADIEAWIAAGAPWPEEEMQLAIREEEAKKEVTEEGVIVTTSGGTADEWTFRRYQPEDIWAFRPVVKPEVPEVTRSMGILPMARGETSASEQEYQSLDTRRRSEAHGQDAHATDPTGPNAASNPVGHHPIQSPVDAFHRAKLEEANASPAPTADARTLIRRVSYDLIGLPPTPEEIESFVAAYEQDSEGAWSQLVEQLLASPHYGERWAQHWFDAARYADTGGMSNDYERSNAWRYRDWVIRSLNEDLPYDQFAILQLAGDELADRSVAERLGKDKVHATRLSGDYTPEEAEQIVATGLLRMGPWDNAMVKDEEARQIYLDDVVNGFGQAFLATTMRCFKCHDHKFDPLPTRDYYRIYAAFATTQMAERPVPFLDQENRDGFAEGRAHVERMHEFAVQEKDKLVNKRETAAKKWYAENNLPYVDEAGRKDLPDEMKPERHVGLDTTEQGQLKVREQDDWIWNRRQERYEPMAQAVFSGGRDGRKDYAKKLRVDGKVDPAWRPENFILTGGALEAKGDSVTPGVLSGIGLSIDENAEDPWALPDTIEGRRLGLAKWVADPRNPLSVRSIVNRVWQGHFGTGIAANANNFGVKGAKPTHPELLDWLAADFVQNGWSLKHLHRRIVLSKAYRMSSEHPEREYLAAEDPDNKLLAWYPVRRLTAEELRDSFLAVTGELNPAMGGLPAMPEINMEVALQPRMIQFSLAPAYQPDPTPERRNRRTVYNYRVRGMADPFLELFNQPNPNDACEIRDAAAVSPQAFSLLNSDLMSDRAIAFALSLEEEASDPEHQIEQAFRRALGRNPDGIEKERMLKYLAEMKAYHATVEPKKPTYPTRITRSLVEEFSGDTFEYEEILPAFENYQADAKPADVDADTRALADVCLLLFNANEFVYVY